MPLNSANQTFADSVPRIVSAEAQILFHPKLRGDGEEAETDWQEVERVTKQANRERGGKKMDWWRSVQRESDSQERLQADCQR